MNRLSKGPLGIVLRYLARQKLVLGRALFWRGLYEIAPMQVPVLTGLVVDLLTSGETRFAGRTIRPEDPAWALTLAFAGLLAVAALQSASSYLRITATAKLSRNFVADLRGSIMEKLNLMSLEVHKDYGSGELLHRAVVDSRQLRLFVQRVFIQMFMKIVRAGYPIAMLLILDLRLALAALAVLPAQILGSRIIQGRLQEATRIQRRSEAELMESIKENLDGIETIQSLSAEEATLSKVIDRSHRLEAHELAADRASASLSGLVWLTTGIGLALTWWLGSSRVQAGEMTVGNLVVMSGFVAFAYQPFRQFTNIARSYRQGLVSLERIQDLLDRPSAVEDPPGAEPLELSEGRIELRDVSFSYGDAVVLDQVGLAVRPRRFTAIVGRSGSGKSSLLRLLVRLYDPDQGQVLIDRQDVRGVSLASLRQQVAVVPQRPYLFTGTVRENVTLARPEASAAAVERACADARAWSFIRDLPRGLETPLGAGGLELSGGEMQRLAIARALLSEPKILLLDEPTSALDPEAAVALLRTLKSLSRRITVLMASHNQETVRLADDIVVMDRGRIAAAGSGDALARQSSTFRDLFVETAVYAG